MTARVLAHMECCRTGRTVLGCMRWAVVVALLLGGYFAAAAINAGFEHAVRADATAGAQQILAASSPQK